MGALSLIEQAVIQYRLINRLSMEIEQAIQKNNLETLASLCAYLDQEQEEAKPRDSTLLDMLQDQKELREHAEIKEWLTLMRSIHERNQRLLPHINSILAVQRNELRTLNKGASVLQGYHSGSVQTGKRISSSG